MDSIQDLVQLLDLRKAGFYSPAMSPCELDVGLSLHLQVSYVPQIDFWGEDMLYIHFETIVATGMPLGRSKLKQSSSKPDTYMTQHDDCCKC